MEDWVDLHVKAIPRKEFDKLKCWARVWYIVTLLLIFSNKELPKQSFCELITYPEFYLTPIPL